MSRVALPKIKPIVETPVSYTVWRVGGKSFQTKGEAQSELKKMKQALRIEKLLGPEAHDPRLLFASGDGYIQHTADAVKKAHRMMADALEKIRPDLHGYLKNLRTMRVPARENFVSRYVDDSVSDSNTWLTHVYWRLTHIDSKNREWGQPYFALGHPRPDAEKWTDRKWYPSYEA